MKFISKWLMVMVIFTFQPVRASQKYVKLVADYTPTTSLLSADMLQRKMSYVGTGDFELVEHNQVPQQVVPPKSDEKMEQIEHEGFVVIDIKKKSIFAGLPNELLALAFKYLDPFSREAETFFRIIPLTKESAHSYAEAIENVIIKSLVDDQAKKKLSRLLCCFMRVLPTVSQTMSPEAQKQVMMMCNNAQALSDALYVRVKDCVKDTKDKRPRYLKESVFCEDIDNCFRTVVFPDYKKGVSLASEHFKRVNNATPAHASSLLYAALLFVNDQDLIKEISFQMKKLLPYSLRTALGYKKIESQCCVVQCSFWSNVCIAVALSITILVVMHIVYRYAYFDADDGCRYGCYFGNIEGERCSIQTSSKMGYPVCSYGTCQVRESGLGLYCKRN